MCVHGARLPASMVAVFDRMLEPGCGALVLQLVVHFFRAPPEPGHLKLAVLRILEHLMLCVDRCNFFLCTHGAFRPDNYDAVEHGCFVSVPRSGASKYYLDTVNHFGACGGFDLMAALPLQVWQARCAVASTRIVHACLCAIVAQSVD